MQARAVFFVILAPLLCAACSEEPDFDERFETAEQSIAERAKQIDAEIEQEPEKNEAGDSDRSRAQ